MITIQSFGHRAALAAALFSFAALACTNAPAARADQDPLATNSAAAEQLLAYPASSPPSSPLQFEITPYVWLPGIHGTLNFVIPTSGGNAGLSTNPNKYLSTLNSALMFNAEVRKDTWEVGTDLIYLNLSDDASTVRTISGPGGNVMIPLNLTASARVTSTIWEVEGGHAFVNNSKTRLDGFVGFRYFAPGTSVNWTFSGPEGLLSATGSAGASADLIDGIVGVKGRIGAGSNGFFVPYYVDAGAGSSQFTWQAWGGAGYAWPSFSVEAVYRNLYYNQGTNKAIQSLNFGGPALGFTFRL